MKHFLHHTVVLPLWSVALLAGTSLGLVGAYYVNADCSSKYRFIDSRVACSDDYAIDKRAYTELRLALLDMVGQAQETGGMGAVSIYFRDLKAGPTLGINEYQPLVPASLLKLVLLTAYLDFAEDNEGVMTRSLTALPLHSATGAPAGETQVGEQYLVQDLLQRMAQDSDEVAFETLKTYLAGLKGTDPVRAQAYALGITSGSVTEHTLEEPISVQAYASIWHNLYFARHLSPETSEQALALLAGATHTSGLVAGVPNGVPVAHRFRERARVVGIERQISDCGIVYYPENPYSLCVVVEGEEASAMTQLIRDISLRVYAEVVSRTHTP